MASHRSARRRAQRDRRRSRLEELERRVLLSAELPVAPLVQEPLADSANDAGTLVAPAAGNAPATTAVAVSHHELAIVDTSTPDYQTLVDDLLKANDGSRQIDILLLDPSRDGFQQITEALAGREDLSAIHLISHGSAGNVQLGGSTLNADTLLLHAADIAQWGESLTKDGDLLIYGCDVTSTAEGQQFVDALSQLTGADVAASEDKTGAADLGGDWDLETTVGNIDTAAIQSASWQHVLAPTDLYAIPGVQASSLIGVYGFTASSDLGRDGAGNDAPITLYGSPTQTTGPDGSGALDLAGGASGQYGNIAGITTGGAMTFAASVRFDSTGNWQRVFDFGQTNSTGISAIYVGRYIGTNDLTFTIEKDLGGGFYDAYRANASGAIVNGTWLHFAATVDASGTMKLYINGTLVTTTPGIVPETGVRTNNYIGKSNWPDAAFDGAIDNLVIANGAMSAAQVAALYQQSTGFTVTEASANGTVVGTVTANDPVAGNTHTFSLTDSAGGRFAIDATGTITVANGAAIDYETATSHSITVRVADQLGNAYTETFTVSITNIVDTVTVTTTADNNDSGIVTGAGYDINWLNNNKGADGKISLREAIIAANNTSSLDTISFNIPDALVGGVHTITLSSLLPTITDAVVINGASEPDWATGSRPVVAINGGTTIADGLRLWNAASGGSTVRGLILQNFTSKGIDIATSNGNTIAGNWIGLNSAGTGAAPNLVGVNIWNSANNIIGGSTADDRNVISGNSNTGIVLATNNGSTSGNQIKGNYIGTNAAGTSAVGNTNQGVWASAAGNTIGGTGANEGNVISGTTSWVAIELVATASNTTIAGNLIGLNAAGTAAIANAGGGLYIQSGSNTIGGVTVNARNVISGNGGAGITITGASATSNVVIGNYVGTNAAGTGDINGTGKIAGRTGIVVDSGASNNRIGTNADGVNDSAERNIISGNNWYGIDIVGSGTSGNVVQGNYIGTDVTGLVALGNSMGGVSMWDGVTNNRVGGGASGAGNVIAGNETGVLLANGVSSNKVQGNYIGIGADGSTKVANTGAGVYFYNGATTAAVTNNLIGTDGDGTNDAGERNVISGNVTGIALKDAEVSGNTIAGNYIGTDATGTLNRGNSASGVLIYNGANSNVIGGTTAARANVIAYNGSGSANNDGITVTDSTSTGNVFLRNATFGNTGLGIDLGNDGVTANDTGDGDSGPNNLQNTAALTRAVVNGTSLTLSGTLSAPANTYYRIEIYASTSADPSGSGEGQTFLNAVNLSVGATGTSNFSINFSDASLAVGQYISVTVTRCDSTYSTLYETSEFSNAIIAESPDSAPAGQDVTISVAEDTTYTFTAADFPFTDADGDSLSRVWIESLPGSGTLLLNGVAVAQFDSITAADINAGLLTYVPASNVNGTAVTSFDFTIQDNGSAFGGGATTDPFPNTVTINISAVNDPPVVTTTGTVLAYTENQAATAVDAALTVSDVDNSNLTGATVSISANYANGQDVLAFTGQLGITGSWNASTGVLTLTGTTTAANYQTALRSITYANTSDAPSTATRTVSFVVNDGSTSNTAATRNVSVTAVNDAPVLDNTKSPVLTAQSEDSGAPVGAVGTLVSSLVDFASPIGQVDNVTDPDAGALLGIAVTAADTSNGSWWYSIDGGGTWNALGSVSGSSALLLAADGNTRLYFQPNANYNATLASAITFRAWDLTSGSAGSKVDLSAPIWLDQFNSATYAGSNGTGTWSGNWIETDNNGGGASGGSILVGGGRLQVGSDRSGDNVYRAVNLSGQASATLSFNFTNNITGGATDRISVQVSADGGATYTTLGSFDHTQNTGSGSTSYDISAYASSQTRIRFIVTINDQGSTVLFDNVQITGSAPVGGSTAFSAATDTASLTVIGVNDPPTLSNLGNTVSYTEGGSSVVLAASATVADAELSVGNNFNGATLTLARNGGANSTDALAFDGVNVTTSGANVAVGGVQIGTYTFSGGQLDIAFNGNATNARVNTLLQNIVYWNTSDAPPSSVQIDWTFRDGNGGAQGSGGALSTTASTTVSITATNDPPTFTSSAVTAATEDSAYSYAITTSDVDAGAVLTITAPTLPAWLTLTDNGNGTATLTGTPTNANVGTHSVVLQVSDGTASVSQSFTITVANTNDAPTFTSSAVTAATEDSAYSYAITTSDVDAGAVLTITAPTRPAWLTLTDNGNGTATLTGTPTNSQVGSYSVVLQVSDGTVTTSQSFTVVVAAQNDAPTDIVATRYLSDQAYLTTSNIYTFDLDKDHGGGQLRLDGVGYAKGLGTHPFGGTAGASYGYVDYAINDATRFKATIGINDGTSGTGSAQFYVYVDNVLVYSSGTITSDSAPINLDLDTSGGSVLRLAIDNADGNNSYDHAIWANARLEGGTVGLGPIAENATNGTVVGSVVGSDIDTNDNWTYELTDNAGGRFAINASTGRITVANGSLIDHEAAASHSITVKVTDTGGLSTTRSFNITNTNVNEAPAFTSSAVTAATEDSAYSYSITTSDVDAGAVLTITAPTLPAWLTLTDNGNGTATLTGTPTNAQVGTHSVMLQVSDGTLSVTQSFTITVANSNDQPTVANPIADQSATEDTAFSFQFASNSFADVDVGDSLTYSASGLPAWLSFNAATRTFSGTPANADVGTTTITVRATDGSGTFVEDSFDLVVSNTNDAPVLDSSGTMTLSPIAKTNLTGNGNTVAQFIASAGGDRITDVDAGAVEGIALTGTTVVGSGHWEYSLDSGGSWSAVGSVSDSNALLLRSTDRLRFVPDGTSTGSASLTLRAWDQSAGAAGSKVSAASNGGTTAFSTATESATLSIVDSTDLPTAVDDAAQTQTGAAVTINVVGNDIDDQGHTLTVLDASNGAHGDVSISGGSVTYTPDAGFSGDDSFQYVVTDGNQGLTHYWRLDGTGTDVVGGANGTLMNGPTTIDGHYGSALQFDGVNDYVDLPDITYGSEFSLAFYFQIADNSGDQLQYLYSHGVLPNAGLPNTIQVGVVEASHATLAQRNNLITTVWDGNDTASGQLLVDISTLIGDGQWHLYTMTVTPGVGTNVYVDGVLRGNIARGGDPIDPNGHAYIGARSDLEPTRFLNAGSAVDGLSIYSRSLSDGEVSDLWSGAANVGMTSVHVNAPPVVTTSGGAVTFTENGPAVAIDSGVTLSDANDTTLTGATIRISGNYSSGNDVLSFTNQLGITGSWDATTGTLTLSGSASVANYQTAIRTITFSNGSESPSTALRTISLTVTDGKHPSATATCTVTVVAQNDQPTVANPIANQSATEDAAFSFQFASNTFADVDVGDSLTYSASGLPAWLSFNAATRTFSGTPANADVGTVTITVRATDSSGQYIEDAFDIVVANTNDPPTVANAIPNQSATEDSAFSFQFASNTFAEVDVGDSLTYSASGLPAWLSFNAATRTFSGTPANADVGTATITVRATDGSGTYIEDSFDIVVANSNDPPTVANAIPNQSATEDSAFSFQFASNTFADVDVGDSLTYSASGLPAWLSFDAATRTFSGTPANADVGTVTITVRATDGGGAYIEDSFDIVVANTNDAPAFTSSAVTAATEDSAYSYSITTSDVDVGDTLTITAPTLPAWLTLTDNGNGTATLTGTPSNAEVGTHSVVLQLSDGTVSVTQSFTITVANSNDQPTIANAIPNQSATEDSAFSFQFAANTFDDVDVGDALTYSASGLPAWLSFDAATRTFSGTPANADVGTVTITVRATDGSGAFVDATFDVTVANTNDAPAFTSSAITAATEDSAYSYSITTSDVDVGDTLTITAPTLPAWLTLTDNGDGTATLTGTPTNAEVGTHSVVLQIGDGTVSVTQSFTITVANSNDQPTIANAIPNQSATEDSAFSFQFAANTFDDVDVGDVLTYSASGLPAWLSFDAATRTFSGTPANADVGTVTITVRATDGGGAYIEDSFDIVVANTNDAPAFTSSAITAATEDSAYSYSITTSDVDVGDTLTITAPTLPAWLTLTDNGDGTATLTGTPSNAEVGTHSVVLQISDGTVSVTQSFTITVANTNDAPAFTSSAVTAATEDSAYSYSITTSDVDVGDTLTITAPTLPAWLTLTDNGDGTATLTGTPTNAEVGTHSVVLQLSDGTVSVTQSFTITVANSNDQPTIANAIPNQSATEDSAFSFQFAPNTFDDVDVGDALTYSASGLPAWLSFDAATRTFSGTPANADVGTVTISVRATDGSGAFVDATFDVTVANTNDAPTLANPIADQSAGSDSHFSFQFAANAFDDVDSGDTLTFTTSALPAWLSFDPVTRSFTGTPGYADVGTVSVTVTATDGVGASVSDTFTITIVNTNVGPTLARNLVLSVSAGTTGAIDNATLLAADVDNTPAQLTYTLLSTPLHGEVLRGGVSLASGDTFSQADIDAGRVVYVHDGTSSTSDSFLFTVSDGEGGSIGTSRFAVSITRDAGGTPIVDTGGGSGGGSGAGSGGGGGAVPGGEPPSDGGRDDTGDETSDDRSAPPVPSTAGNDRAREEPLSPTLGEEDVDAGYRAGSADRGSPHDLPLGSMSVTNAERSGKPRGGIVAPQANMDEESTPLNGLNDALASLKEQLQENLRDGKGGPDAAAIAAATASVAASAGYLTWLLRGGSLFASVLASMPAWRTIDPLPVLAKRRDDGRGLLATRQENREDEDDDEESILDPRTGTGT